MTDLQPDPIDANSRVADPDMSRREIVRRWRRGVFITRRDLRRWLARDLSALGLWTPVAIGVGVGIYFSLHTEPEVPHTVIGFCTALIVSLLLNVFADHRFRFVSAGLFFVALGFCAADLRTDTVAEPILSRDLGMRDIEGVIVSVEERERDQRFLVELTSVEGLAPEQTPRRARILWRGARADVGAGVAVQLRADLGPPPPPATPGGFDFARRLYFQRIGAIGFSVTPPLIVSSSADAHVAYAPMREVEKLRAYLFHRIVASAPGQGGAIIAAIITGKRDAISEEARAALRDAGLAHLLAISGLHMGLATGLIFFFVRAGLSLLPRLALAHPIKKWSAAAALFSGMAYLIISGGGWSARRAFIMAAIIFLAMLFDRRAISLRNVAIAAVIVLLTTPEALFHPGFQMSFAAVTALIAAYEWASRRASPDRDFGMLSRFKRYAIGLGATDTIAALATAPYALFHFNRVAIYSLPANLLSMPLMAFWVMPAAVLGLVLSLVGLDRFFWVIAARGMEVILSIATTVSSWEGAVSLTPQWPMSALLIITAGGLWLCLARSPLRYVGMAAIPVAALVVATQSLPDIFIAASGRNAGIVLEDDRGRPELFMYTTRRDRFSASVWGEALGLDVPRGRRRPSTRSLAEAMQIATCDAGGCVAMLPI